MMPDFSTPTQERLFNFVADQLRRIGYRNDLLQREYKFRDFFTPASPTERRIPIAAFGQIPLNFQNACYGVFLSHENQQQGAVVIGEYRSLGAPFQFEVRPDRIVLWIVGSSAATTRPYGEYDDEARLARALQGEEWSPEEVLRAKNIGFGSPRLKQVQLDFYDTGLIPAIEEQITRKLDPILRDALAATVKIHRQTTGNPPDDREMFRLAFRLLAGKVFHDMELSGFVDLNVDSGPDVVLEKVAAHYREKPPRILNYPTREVAFNWIWSGLDFRNLTVDVLAHIWTHTLVSDEIRSKYGIHITPRTIAKYIVDRLPFETFMEGNTGNRLVVEPCCGPAPFLIAAMQRIRDLTRNLTPSQRHFLFQNILVGFEQGTFGVEIAKLCLSVADFPEPNGWEILEQNIFTSVDFPRVLGRAGIVLCNPPFEDLPPSHPHRDKVASVHQPAEILHRVLDSISPDGVLGFVMPRKLISGDWYPSTRRTLIARFNKIELVSLPDIAFRESDSEHETVLLLATEPRQNGTRSTVRHRRVDKEDWQRFTQFHEPTSDDVVSKTIEESAVSLAAPLLGDVWNELRGYKRLGETATVSRGIEWKKLLVKKSEETGHRQHLVLDESKSWTREGVPPLAEIWDFERPATKHLNMKPEEQRRNPYKLPWDLPKVILNASRRSRGPWRLSAFADYDQLACHRSYIAVWPNDPQLTTAIAAVLNGPVANAFAATFEGANISVRKLRTLPMPEFTSDQVEQIGNMVREYLAAVKAKDWKVAGVLLRQIDAVVLQAYDLSPRVERKLLDYFRGKDRPIPFHFGEYFPTDFRPCLPLADYLSHDFQLSTAREFRNRREPPPEHVLRALRVAAKIEEG